MLVLDRAVGGGGLNEAGAPALAEVHDERVGTPASMFGSEVEDEAGDLLVELVADTSPKARRFVLDPTM